MKGQHKRDLFVREYLVDLNASQAAIRAGYSPKSARRTADKMLGDPLIAKAIEKAMSARAGRIDVTADNVLRELARIGFSDIRKVVKWGASIQMPASDEDGEAVVVNGIALLDSESLDDDTARAISEISKSEKGTVKVKMYDKRAALVDLGKHIGLFPHGKKDATLEANKPAAAIVVPAKVKADPNERPPEVPGREDQQSGVVLRLKREG